MTVSPVASVAFPGLNEDKSDSNINYTAMDSHPCQTSLQSTRKSSLGTSHVDTAAAALSVFLPKMAPEANPPPGIIRAKQQVHYLPYIGILWRRPVAVLISWAVCASTSRCLLDIDGLIVLVNNLGK